MPCFTARKARVTISHRALNAALLAAGLGVAPQAQAACTPDAPASNASVLCTGTTQNAGNGFGSRSSDNTTVTVESGATVAGGLNGVILNLNGRIINQGTISGTSASEAGVFFNGTSGRGVLENSGTVTAGGYILFSLAGLSLTNSGTMRSPNEGIAAVQALDVTNSGTISAGSRALSGSSTLSLTNSGLIESRLGVAVSARAMSLINSGIIRSAEYDGVDGESLRLTNSGTISAGRNAVSSTAGNAHVVNNGLIRGERQALYFSAGANSTQTVENNGELRNNNDVYSTIYHNSAISILNRGSIVNEGRGITIAGTAAGRTTTVENYGLIQSYSRAISAFNINVTNSGSIISSRDTAIYGEGAVFVENRGSITADAMGIYNRGFGLTRVVNSGTVRSHSGVAIQGNGNGVVENSGTLESAGGGINIGGDINLTNSGTLRAGGDYAVTANTMARIHNSGTISGGGDGIYVSGSMSLTNTGTITAAERAVLAGVGALNLRNTGTISGGSTGPTIEAGGDYDHTITNSGRILSSGGLAILTGNSNDTLTLARGSQIYGRINLRGGNNTVNIETGPESAIWTVEGSNITFNNTGTGTLVRLGPNSAASLQSRADHLIAPDIAFETLGATARLVEGRLSGQGTAGMVVQTEGDEQGLVSSYAPRHDRNRHGPFTKDGRITKPGMAPVLDPVSVWASGFGALSQRSGAQDLRMTTYGGAIGIDRRFGDRLLVGAFAGGGAGRARLSGSGSVDSGFAFAGVYGRFQLGRAFVDATLQGGGLDTRSTRGILNNMAPGGTESVQGQARGFYLSPEIALGQRYTFAQGFTLTPVLRLRYIGGAVDGYSETGSLLALSYARRTFHALEERAEVEAAHTLALGTKELTLTARVGALARQRLGGQAVNATFGGQSFALETGAQRRVIGATGTLGFDYRFAPRMSLYGQLEAQGMSDRTLAGAARGGLRIAF